MPASYNDLFADPEVRDHVGWVCYQREVRVPRGWGDDEVLLRFDAATHAARVYVDDRLVGEHVGGYTPFEVDLTDVVPAGGEFRLTVAVSSELTNETVPPGKIEVGMDGRRRQTYFHDFYNYAGLARSVWLYSRPRTHVDDITVITGFEGTTGSVDYRVATSDAGRGQGAPRGRVRRDRRRGDRGIGNADRAGGRAVASGRGIPLRPDGRGADG